MSKYRIERLVGIGGAAVVYEARPLLPGGDGAPVACKLMREAHRADAGARALVRQEAALGLRVTPGHSGLVRVLDCFEDAGEGPCIVMELVDGSSLKALLGPNRLPFPITRRITRDVLQALAHLHDRDVLHRDLSPCNILISTSGSVKIADLGIARVMEGGHTYTRNYRGKVAYDSPEAIQTLTLDARSDLFALGAVLYELLAGAPPGGDTDTFASVVMRTLRGEFAPLPADTPADLAGLATGLLCTDRDAREPRTATEALALLRQHHQPMASDTELAALVLAMRAQRGAEPDGAHRAPTLAPGEMLEPGDVLGTRADLEPGVSMQGAAAARPPVFALPPEPALPSLPQPAPRSTATLARPGAHGASPPGIGLDAAGPEVPAHVRGGVMRARLRTTGHAALVRVADVAVTALCLLALGLLLADGSRGEQADGSRGEQDVREPQQATGEPAPVAEPALPVAPAPVPVRREASVLREETASTTERPRVTARADEPHGERIQTQRGRRRTGSAPMRRPEPLGDQPPSWATP